ncbi:MAG: hypothetical protein COA65_09740 [Rhodospirillaceae bacterium]|nr:MAG: hypothetical protein COA65_09740 [Rhodospirillaceae bacterium]
MTFYCIVGQGHHPDIVGCVSFLITLSVNRVRPRSFTGVLDIFIFYGKLPELLEGQLKYFAATLGIGLKIIVRVADWMRESEAALFTGRAPVLLA